MVNAQQWLESQEQYRTKEKREQITELELLGQNLVFKYKKWITNKELLDFVPHENEGLKTTNKMRGTKS
jgi:hypothetical protein